MNALSRAKPWMFVSAIWLWPAVFHVVERVLQTRLQGWPPASPSELLFTFWDWLAYAIVTPAIFWASTRWPVVRPHLARRVATHLGFALLFCLVWATVGKVLQLLLTSTLEPERLEQAIRAAGPNLPRAIARNVTSWLLTTIPFGVVVYTTVAGLAHAIRYFTEARERDLQMARLNEQLATARYAALQAQMNPHFLFNTLNTITVLVRDGDRQGAVRIVEQLSDVLRRTMRRHGTHEVTLHDELELVRQYLAIEEARFSDRLRPEFEIAQGLDNAVVPGFIVQHLVENAIRHGLARREEAGRLRIRAFREGAQLIVNVEDDGPGMTTKEIPPGRGIANTRERLRAIHGDAASLVYLQPESETGTIARLSIPWRELAEEVERADT